MEQRIGSSSQPQPLEGAGFDPAFIPGLTAPVPGTSDRKADVKDAQASKGEEEPRDAVPETDATSDAEPGATTSLEKPGTSGAPETSADPEGEPVPDGPVFEASDRRAEIVADHSGVRLRLDDQACEFRWDEIGAVETETARFGKRYTVTVHTTERRWYPIEIEAASRSRFAAWDTELDAVLDAYFEDGTSEPEGSGPEGSDADTADADAPETDAPETDSPDAESSGPDADAGKPASDAGVDPSDDGTDKPKPDAGPAA
ncbi:hypothetical protein [Streptomyces prasinus]|uniref:Uncharacterized protein n=1 Tax=Streptomyces prasinus TaxID=67345 RepID=A0ABX6B1M7_9ACTN|nr:hypothetical protein [Streptomyces prasinus]QEV08064.1 hypothetical protein CP972_22690 [Streptomyces prasinus]